MFKKWLAQKSTRAGLAVLVLTVASYFAGQIPEAAAIIGAGSALAGMVYPEGRKGKIPKDQGV